MQVNNIFFNLWNWKMVMMFAQFFVQWAILVCWPYRIIMYHQWNTRWYTQPTSIHHHSYSWCNVVLQQQVKDTMTRWVFGLLLHWNKSNKIWHSFGIIETLKDVIKQVVPLGIPPYEIHESQMVRQLFFWDTEQKNSQQNIRWWWCLHNVNVQWSILMCWPYRIIMYHQQNIRWYTQPTLIHHHSYSWCNVVLQQQVKDTTTRQFFGLLLYCNKLNKI